VLTLKTRFADEKLVHPRMRKPLLGLVRLCADMRPFPVKDGEGVFRLFESYRTPQRQDQLNMVAAGQKQVTQVGAFGSAHQFGLAADFAVWRDHEDPRLAMDGWMWPDDAPWHLLKAMAENVGLEAPLKWDRGHVQHPVWPSIQNLLRSTASGR